MIFDVCFFKYSSGQLSQFPAIGYAKRIINESLKLSLALHGKRQFSLIKRAEGGNVRLYNIYNYVYNDSKDSIGICIVFHDKYPYDIEYLFKLYGLTISSLFKGRIAFAC